MKILFKLPLLFVVTVGSLAGCKKEEAVAPAERAEGANLKEVKDPVLEEIFAFRQDVRQDYNNRRFAELENRAAEFRRTKSVFDNGSWKLLHFYESFTCRSEEPESMWQLHDQIHRDWISAFPQSVTARVAYADFFISYGWQARGSGFADEVKPEAWRLFGERIAAGGRTLAEARQLPEKDPIWWNITLRLARSQGWSKSDYERAVDEAKSFEPHYWGYDVSRAESLLPRWYGKPGDWEAYSEQVAARPDGLGVEVYARIVMRLRVYYQNVFRETKASWPTTRAGLERLRKLYPRSLDIMSETALLAVLADDRALAREMFDQIGDRYFSAVWDTPEYFVRSRKWAEAGP
jgi:hypothetical protein